MLFPVHATQRKIASPFSVLEGVLKHVTLPAEAAGICAQQACAFFYLGVCSCLKRADNGLFWVIQRSVIFNPLSGMAHPACLLKCAVTHHPNLTETCAVPFS